MHGTRAKEEDVGPNERIKEQRGMRGQTTRTRTTTKSEKDKMT